MPKKRLSMRKIREVLRLRFCCKRTIREISESCSIGRGSVSEYLLRAKAANLSWPLPDGMDDNTLEQLLFPSSKGEYKRKRVAPSWHYVHKELKRKSVTLSLLWQEYKRDNPEGYQYSWFCHNYADWVGKIDLVMRQDHIAGEKLFVDYAGQTVPISDRHTGKIREAQIFIAVLGASNYTYAEATWSQSLPDWISSHVRAFKFMGGVPKVLVPDNLKSGVKKPCYYDPDINPTYQNLASHYGVIVLPTRIRKARDKAKVETGVQIVERWILARLRNHKFFGLSELNNEIRRLLEELNNKPFQKLPGTRKSTFDTLDRPALNSLPSVPYQYAEWKIATVHIDYHVEIGGHYYSVPYQLIRKKLDVRITPDTVECFHRNKRVASHKRRCQRGGHTTLPEHMPAKHRHYLGWSPERFRRWAAKIGPQTLQLAEAVLAARPYPQQAYRSLLGILRLAKSYTDQRLEAACQRALAIGTTSYRSIESILKNNLDRKPLLEDNEPTCPVEHQNIRGSRYYEDEPIQ